jgi:hypothetical protein
MMASRRHQAKNGWKWGCKRSDHVAKNNVTPQVKKEANINNPGSISCTSQLKEPVVKSPLVE